MTQKMSSKSPNSENADNIREKMPADNEINMDVQKTYGCTTEPTLQEVNEEGDAPAIKQDTPTDPKLDKDAKEKDCKDKDKENEMPFSKQRLGAYKHFARTANRTLTTFTNEMSEILRQSIERLDSISMKVRGCVYEIERQRVAMPTHTLQPLADIKEIEGDGTEPRLEDSFWEKLEEGEKTCDTLPLSVTASLISDIKEIAVKCKKTPSTERIQVDANKNESKSVKDASVEVNVAPSQTNTKDKQFLIEKFLDNDKLQLNVLKENIKKKIRPVSKEDSANPTKSTSKKTSSNDPTSSSNIDEKEVIHRINKHHKRTKRRKTTISIKTGSDTKLPPTTADLVDPATLPTNVAPPKKIDQRKRRIIRKRDSGAASKTLSPNQKRARHSKKVIDAYANENYSDATWFGPKICATSTTSSSPRKSAKSSKSIRLTQAGRESLAASHSSKMEVKNTRLARKFASSNFHDIQTTKVESYTGGRVVRLTSDSKQDWSVIMHTQKAPTRYELRQNSPLPTNNILDEITLKDLAPLKAEYPRRDNLVTNQIRLEDTLLYKLVNGSIGSIETLIDVTSKVKHEDKDKPHQQPLYGNNNLYNSPSPLQATQLSGRAGTPTVKAAPPTSQLKSSSLSPTKIMSSTRQLQALIPSVPVNKKVSRTQSTTQKSINASNLQAKGDSSSRAGIYRTQRSTALLRQPPGTKPSIMEHSKRIAIKLSQIKNTIPPKSPSVHNQNIYQANKKDAKRRLKKYLADPNKTHQKYMVLMVYKLEYNNYKLAEGGRYVEKTKTETEEILDKYIYLNDDKYLGLVPETNFIVGVMTNGTTTNLTKRGGAKSWAEPVNVKPTRDRDVETRSTRHLGAPPSYRRAISPMPSPSTTVPAHALGIASTPTANTKNMGEASWKHVIRSCYSQPNNPLQTQTRPRANMMDGNKVLNPLEVKNIISNMEVQLKHVLENPKIENKETVIKDLQEQMEWILSNLEGQTSALKKRKQNKLKPDSSRLLTSNSSSTSSQNPRKREPILKPVEVLTPKSTKNITTNTSNTKILGAALPIDSLSPNPSPLSSSGYLKTSPASANVQTEDFEPLQLKQKSSGSLTPSTIPDEIQTKLMNKWQTLENPSGASVDILSLNLSVESSTTTALNPKKVKSRPETRRERRSSISNCLRKSNSTASNKYLNLNLGKEKFQTQPDFVVNPKGKELTKIQSEQEFSQDITEINKLNDNGAEDSYFDQSNNNNEVEDGIKVEKDNGDNIEVSVYNSCPQISASDTDNDKGDSPKLTPQEIAQYQENIKFLETQLGAETQRFVDEMDEVIKQIETKTLPDTPKEQILTPLMDAVSEYHDITLNITNMGNCINKNVNSNDTDDIKTQEVTTTINKTDEGEVNEKQDEFTTETLTSVEYVRKLSSVTSLQPEVEYVADVTEPIQIGIGTPFNIPITNDLRMEVEFVDQSTDCTQGSGPIQPMTSKEISLTLSHDMRRHFKNKVDVNVPDDPNEEKKPKDYDLMEPKTKESPMMQDIKRSLFGKRKKAKDNEVKLASITMQTNSFSFAGKNASNNESLSSRLFNRMSWEMTDKSTTMSMTNLTDYLKNDCANSDVSRETKQLELKRSKSEVSIQDSRNLSGKASLGRTVQLVESAISAHVTRFLNETTLGIPGVSDSMETILSATLQATLAHAQQEKNANLIGVDCDNVDRYGKRDFPAMLTLVYTFMFTMMCLGLTFCPTCIA